jgi:hypothetical protein
MPMGTNDADADALAEVRPAAEAAMLRPTEVPMPGTIFRGRAAEPAGEWKDGKLLDDDGVGTVLAKRGAEYFAGKSASPAWRVRGGIVYRGASSEPFCRVQGDVVYKGNTSETLYRLRGDALLGPAGADPVVRGPGLTPEELVLGALALQPPR